MLVVKVMELTTYTEILMFTSEKKCKKKLPQKSAET